MKDADVQRIERSIDQPYAARRNVFMKRNKQFSDYNEHGKYTELGDIQERILLEQRQVDMLMERGFLWEEAVQLVQLHEHIYENAEVKQRLEEDAHMQFTRWLYEQGIINEDMAKDQ
jgi:hypothetical protein